MLLNLFVSKFLLTSHRNKKKVAILLDILSIILCLLILNVAETKKITKIDISLILNTLLFLLIFFVLAEKKNVYSTVIRFVGINLFVTLGKSIASASLIVMLINMILQNSSTFLRSLYNFEYFRFLGWATLSLLLIILWRLLARFLINFCSNKKYKFKSNIKKIAIYGAGQKGRLLASILEKNNNVECLCFIDDDIQLQDRLIGKIIVISPSKFEKLYLGGGEFFEILIAINNITKFQINKIVNQFQKENCKLRIVNEFGNFFSEKINKTKIRDIEIEDVLGREPITPIDSLIKKCIEEKVVLITGAGGSIGGEIARQVATNLPKKILLLDSSEYLLFKIYEELIKFKKEENLNLDIIPILGSVLDRHRLDKIFGIWKPQTVYHAAAYKHVHLVEKNAMEGIRNNVIGTKNCLDISHLTGVEYFVLISTDKAVRPTNVMGLSKRICELLTIRTAMLGSTISGVATKYSIVRFGNVLGSSGSVIPIFKDQIERGGPVTVTDRNASRFFMTIKEAAQLVIQAGSMTRNMDIFILDMGEPIKIYDLALKMIELSGKEIDKGEGHNSIKVVFTGLKNGEKLNEELYINHLDVENTQHPRIKLIRVRDADHVLTEDKIQNLEYLISVGDLLSIIKEMSTVIPESKINLKDDLFLCAHGGI
jgi:FlaA1/EpsC-like NDP-sugar epimerase